MESHLVARAHDCSILQTGSNHCWVKGRWNGSRHLAARTENHTEEATDGSHVWNFGEEEINTIRKLASLLTISTEVLDGRWVNDVDSGGARLGSHLATGEHGNLHRLAATCWETDLLLDTVCWVLQVDVLQVERELDGLSELALRSAVQGLFNCCLYVVFHIPHLCGQRGSPLPQFVIFHSKCSLNLPSSIACRAALGSMPSTLTRIATQVPMTSRERA